MAVASNDRVAALVERETGVRVDSIERQARWRPAWFVDATGDDGPVRFVVRGERVDTIAFPLSHEMAFHRILQDNGIAVPRIHGWIDEIDAAILENVPGKVELVGLDDAARDAIVDDYLQELVRIHALPKAPFLEAGLLHAKDGEDAATVGHFHMERLWREKKRHPHPFLEWALGWLHRNPPRANGRECPIVWDSGQFHHDGRRMTAVLDLEFGHVGDPLLDLTVWRMRDTLLHFGDMEDIYRRYEAMTGHAVDRHTMLLHHFGGTLGNEMMFGPAVLDPVPETDLMNNMQWDSETNLHATEALAELMGLELPTIDIPAPRRTRYDNSHAHLVESLRRMRVDEPFLAHDIRLAFRTARHLARANELGDAVEGDDLDDLHRVLGKRPENWWEGDAELERFVIADRETGAHDEALLWLFHRRNLRVHLLLGPPGSKMVAHYPTQRFDGRTTPDTAQFARRGPDRADGAAAGGLGN